MHFVHNEKRALKSGEKVKIKKQLEAMLNKNSSGCNFPHIVGGPATVYGRVTGYWCPRCGNIVLWPEKRAPFPYTEKMKWDDFRRFNSVEEIEIDKLKKRVEKLEKAGGN